MRGTNSVHSECVLKKWINENKQVKSFLSKLDYGQKISSCKGTSTIWIKKQPKKVSGLPTKRVLVLDRGTRRIIVEN
jgi:hypothetical protein